MFDKALAAAAIGLCLIGPACAAEAAPEAEQGRYTFSKVAGGFVRLDTKTGAVSLCGRRTVGWACQAVPEDRAVLENEIARLRSENALLKKDILSRGLPLPAGAMPEPPVLSDGAPDPHARDNSDLDRVVNMVGRLWHGLVGAIARAKKQMLNKT